MAIESAEYGQTRARLMRDPIVCDMAKGLRGVALDAISHPDGSPRFEFMMGANAEYAKRAGHRAEWGHIGAVAQALLRLLELDAIAAAARRS